MENTKDNTNDHQLDDNISWEEMRFGYNSPKPNPDTCQHCGKNWNDHYLNPREYKTISADEADNLLARELTDRVCNQFRYICEKKDYRW